MKNEYANLAPYKESIYYCNECRCGFCREECPVYIQSAKEHLSARGKMAATLAFLEKIIKPSEKLIEATSLCCTCGWCVERCPTNNAPAAEIHIDIPKIIEAFRADLARTGKGPATAHRRIAHYIQKSYNPLGEPKAKRLDWLRNHKLPAKADIIYFAGCMASHRVPETALSTVKVLKKAGDFTILEDERCCGSPLFRTGQIEKTKELMEHNIRSIEDIGGSKVVTACAGCYRTFKFDYPRFTGKPNFEVLHISEFINELCKSRKIRMRELRENVTYHDPCHLGRQAGVYIPPREAISNVPGVKIIEMEYNRRLAKCCGAGGGLRSAWRNISIQTARDRINDAKRLGVRTMVTACPFCTYNLTDAKDRAIKIYDLPVFFAKYLILE